jgi:hypothetical protein
MVPTRVRGDNEYRHGIFLFVARRTPGPPSVATLTMRQVL